MWPSIWKIIAPWSQKTISELLQELRGKNKDIHILNGKNPQHFLCKQNG